MKKKWKKIYFFLLFFPKTQIPFSVSKGEFHPFSAIAENKWPLIDLQEIVRRTGRTIGNFVTLSDLVEQIRCYIVKFSGDLLLTLYPSPTDDKLVLQ